MQNNLNKYFEVNVCFKKIFQVTCVHKANIMKLGDGLFMRSCEEIAALYPSIQFEKMIVDNTTMQVNTL